MTSTEAMLGAIGIQISLIWIICFRLFEWCACGACKLAGYLRAHPL